MMITLSQTFVDQTKQEITPHWGPLGWVTYKRTYARWLPEKNRTENWDETVKRVVEGNINLDPRLRQPNVPKSLQAELTREAEQLFRLVYSLSATPSGRNLWISGTPYQKKHGDALNNCWFINIRPQKYGRSKIVPYYLSPEQTAVSMPFAFVFDELMKGGGVGLSVAKENISQIPAVERQVKLVVLIGKESASYQECLRLGAIDRDQWLDANHPSHVLFSTLEDSREGWVKGMALLIDAHFSYTGRHIEEAVIDITNIRGKGEKIHGFGGSASGPSSYVTSLFDVSRLLNQAAGRKLTSVDCTDLCNLIAKCVVSGGVRRSAQIAIGDASDSDFIVMKQDKEQLYHHRWASNNSVIVTRHDTDFDEIAASIAQNGEPGIIRLDLARNFGRIIDGYQKDIDAGVCGFNPCGEIGLENGEPCNLFEVFPLIAREQGWDMNEVLTLAVRSAKRVTFSPYDWEVSRKVISRNRRIGISLSGIQDWVLNTFGQRIVTGFHDACDQETGEKISEPDYNPEVIRAVDGFYKTVLEADRTYSEQIGCRPSIKHTTVKPSGTVSKLAGVSEGMHFHYGAYLIQRIRFQDTDPLLGALRRCGYHIEKDVYSDNTMCAEFPVKAVNADSDRFVSSGEVSIEEQFATQAFLQTYWADNAVSCTITFQKNEATRIDPLLRQYRNVIKSTSLLPYSGSGYAQAPKEPITQEKYHEIKSSIHGNVEQAFIEMHTDKKDQELVGQEDCTTGACPVR
ncbi:ribonucleoside-triphosphate reductase, adenosylcobalamin-dependent [Sporolactobacillus sp. THM7-4]|nr:ribonucleoside-triphosphate reductase, adenosylcobalamin-dependent [Sporolactobacillus sp. THM7-4]